MKKMALAIAIHLTFQLCFSYFIIHFTGQVPWISARALLWDHQFSSFSKVIINALENCRV